MRRVTARLAALGLVRVRPGLDDVRRVAQSLADVSARAEGQPPRAVPDVAPHAWGDVLAVLAGDAVRTGEAAATTEAHRLLVELRRALP